MRFLLSFIACVFLLRLTLCFVALRVSLHPFGISLSSFAQLYPLERKACEGRTFCDRLFLMRNTKPIPSRSRNVCAWKKVERLPQPSLHPFRDFAYEETVFSCDGFAASAHPLPGISPYSRDVLYSRQRTLFLRGDSLAKEEANLFAIKMINSLIFFMRNF